MRYRNNFILSAVLTFVGIVSLALEADATPVVANICTVNSVIVDSNSSTNMRVGVSATCSFPGNVTVYGYSGYSCTPTGLNKSAAVVEGFRSLAQTALLSGKKVNLTYDNASGGGCTNGLYGMTLVN